MPENIWEPNTVNCSKLCTEDAKFIFEQAEKHLQDVTESHKSVVERSYTLLAVMISLLTGFIGYGIGRIEKLGWEDKLAEAILITVIYLFGIIIYLLRNIQPVKYFGMGSQPKKLLVDFFFREAVKEEKRLIAMYVSEITRYQERIDVNSGINNKRWATYRKTMFFLLGLPIVFLISYFVLIFVECTQ